MLSSALGGAIAYATLASSTSIEMLFVAKTINGLMMGLPPAVQAYIIDITPQDRISCISSSTSPNDLKTFSKTRSKWSNDRNRVPSWSASWR
jgi:hypothetical protein